MTIGRPSTLRDHLQRPSYDQAVNQGFGAEHSGLASTTIVSLSSDQVEGRRGSAQRVDRSGIADEATGVHWPITLPYLVAGDSISGEQGHRADPCWNHPL